VFKETLNVIPKLDRAGMSRMERLLNSRFARISKSFGRGLMGVLKGGGVVGVALSMINKLLNPLKETQEAIDRTLRSADDTVTNAQQFNSSAGELFKLQKLAQATGLDASGLDMLLLKFQSAVAEAAADPTKQTAVREFAGEDNIVKGFFEFIQALNKMDRNTQVLIQKEVFGERQTLKMAEFLRADFDRLGKMVGVGDASTYTAPLEKLAGLSDLDMAKQAGREIQDTVQKSQIINRGMIEAKDSAEKIRLKRENEAIKNFQNLQAISETSAKIMTLVEKGVFLLGDFINFLMPTMNKLITSIEKMANSPIVRGVQGWFGKGGK